MAKILLVEDDESLSETVTDWLVFQDHIVETAGTGPEALEQLQCSTFDIIILDWNLPGIAGPEICKIYRAEGGRSPVIMLTGMSSAKERETCMNAGANDYLKKPFKLNELSTKLSEYI